MREGAGEKTPSCAGFWRGWELEARHSARGISAHLAEALPWKGGSGGLLPTLDLHACNRSMVSEPACIARCMLYKATCLHSSLCNRGWCAGSCKSRPNMRPPWTRLM